MNTGKHVASVIAAASEDRIAELESKNASFTWCQPFAKVLDYPDIENFLRGPDEKYGQRGLSKIYDARSFAGNYFSTYKEKSSSAGYSALGSPAGWVVTRSVKFKNSSCFRYGCERLA
ncbi:unnamed protein product [Calypogeia fissa]